MTIQNSPTVDELALEFCKELRATLTPEQMREVVARNTAETNPNVCHSHDFCDANMVLEAVFKRHDMSIEQEGGLDRWADLWNASWSLAKSRGFDMFCKGDQVEILEAYRDAGDEDFTWVAASDEQKGRLDICPIDIEMSIKPRYTVEVNWVRRARNPASLNLRSRADR